MTASAPTLTSTGSRDGTGALGHVLRPLRKHWPVVVACALLGAGLGLLYARSQARVYEATTLVEINPHPSQPLGDKSSDLYDLGAGLFYDSREYLETQYKILTSQTVMMSAARNAGLATDYDFFGLKQPPATVPTLEQAAAVLAGRVRVLPVKYSRLVEVLVDDTDPKRAKRLSDAVANAYIDRNLQTALSTTSDAVEWLNGQVDHVRGELEHDENALHDFKQRNDLPSTSINEASNMLRVEMQELDMALTHARTHKAEVAARDAELSRVSSSDPDRLPASELLANPYLQALRTQYQDALKERASLLGEGKGEDHPTVKRADQRIAETRGALLAEVKNIQGAVERDLAIAAREEEAETQLFEATRRRAVDLTMKEIEYHRLDRTRGENEKLYGLLLERMKEADLARMMHANNVRVVDAAPLPTVPVRPRVPVILGVATLLGLLAGMAAAWLREQIDTSLKTPDDLERRLGLVFLGLLPAVDDDAPTSRASRRRASRRNGKPDPAAHELIVHARPLSGVAEAARSVRTNLMFMNPDRPHRKLLVTSAAPSEGKTTVACSIAIAFAQGGERVCIVDCDLRRPRLHRIFDRVGDMGVTNLLVNEATLDQVARPTSVPNLWSIPSGPTPPNPADMLHSERFKQFLAQLGERFDRVIIDSPPLVAVTDGAILSTLVDGTVFVVRAYHTPAQLSLQGLRALRDLGTPIVGGLLNNVNLNRHEYTYYHYYYYKREGYATPTEARPGRPDDQTAAPN